MLQLAGRDDVEPAKSGRVHYIPVLVTLDGPAGFSLAQELVAGGASSSSRLSTLRVAGDTVFTLCATPDFWCVQCLIQCYASFTLSPLPTGVYL